MKKSGKREMSPILVYIIF